MGVLNWLFGSKSENEDVTTRNRKPEPVVEVCLTITSSVSVSHDEETAQLHRSATKLRDDGDLNGAIAALQKAQSLMRNSNFSHTTERWVRLPLFLQQAGRFGEAMEEFNKLLEEIDGLRAREFSHYPKRFHAGFSYHPRSVIYDKMRLACKRQKISEQAEKYTVLRDDFRKRHDIFFEDLEKWEYQNLEREID